MKCNCCLRQIIQNIREETLFKALALICIFLVLSEQQLAQICHHICSLDWHDDGGKLKREKGRRSKFSGICVWTKCRMVSENNIDRLSTMHCMHNLNMVDAKVA